MIVLVIVQHHPLDSTTGIVTLKTLSDDQPFSFPSIEFVATTG
jgi:hypothetical protein